MSLTQKEIDEFWATADKDKDGKLTIQELDAALRRYLPKGKGPSSKDVIAMFCAIDKDGDKTITRQEFETEMLKPPRRETLKETFQRFDVDNSGSLSRKELRDVLKDSGCFKGQNIDAVTDEIMKMADTSGDGSIDLDEFMNAVC